MALHIQMSEEAEKELKKTALRNQLSSILASLAVMVLGGGALFFAVILIVQEAPAVFVSYVPPTENLPPSATPTTAELSSKAATPTNTVSPTVIVSTGAAPVQMAAVEIEAAEIEVDSGIDISMGLDDNLGDGLGDGGAGLGSGSPGGSALVGTFYDLKLTRNGGKTKLYPADGVTFTEHGSLAEVYYNITRSWSPSVLERYYKSPTQLYASSFYLPMCKAEYGPLAYQCDPKKVKPSAWIAIYRGKVRAPKSGKFRFVGTGDDFIAVRFNRKTVLEAGYVIPSKFDRKYPEYSTRLSAFNEEGKEYIAKIKAGKDPDHRGYEYTSLPEGWGWNNVGGLTAGTPFEVKEGQVYPIEVMISEGQGSAFGFALLIEDMTDNPQGKKKDLERVYDLFRTNFSLPNAAELKKLLEEANCIWGEEGGELQCPAYNADSPIWVAVP